MRRDRPVGLSVEERSEPLDQGVNFALYLLKGLYRRDAVGDRYRDGQCELHFHMAAAADVDLLPACFRVRVAGVEEREILGIESPACGDRNVRVKLRDEQVELPVLVRVGKASEGARPVASLVRLVALDQCDVFFAEAFEIGRPPRLAEDVLPVLDRKLRALLLDAGVMRGKLEDDVVEGGAQVVDGLSED